MSPKKLDKNDYKVDVMPYWKDILKVSLSNPAGLKFIKNASGSETSIEFKNDRDNEILQFAEDVGYVTEIKRTILLLSSDKSDALHAVKYFTQIMFSLLNKWKYLKSEEVVDQVHGVEYVHWHLTDKGIEIALKLQEHEDNNLRHLTTVSYSKKAFWVSVGAILVASASMLFSYERLNLYETEVSKVKVDQAAIIKKLDVKKLPEKS